MFQDESGNSRILAIWDQTIQDGVAPEGFYYGTEYKRDDINRAIKSDNPYDIVPSRDTNRHGSKIASVAAGSKIASGYTFLGAAPNCDIVVVKLKEAKKLLKDYYFIPNNVSAYEETDIMLALKYVESFAITFRRAVVICLGVGTNTGDHRGSSFLAGYMNSVALKRSRAIVVWGGNEGNAAHHFNGRLFNNPDGGINYKDVEIRVGENCEGFFLEFWGGIPDIFNIIIRSPGSESTPPLRLG